MHITAHKPDKKTSACKASLCSHILMHTAVQHKSRAIAVKIMARLETPSHSTDVCKTLIRMNKEMRNSGNDLFYSKR